MSRDKLPNIPCLSSVLAVELAVQVRSTSAVPAADTVPAAAVARSTPADLVVVGTTFLVSLN
jgi:hypothetical protein